MILSSVLSLSSVASAPRADRDIFISMSNEFGQPIRKFELWASSEEDPTQPILLWEDSFGEGEGHAKWLSMPTDAKQIFSEYILHYRVELEDGQWTCNNLVLPSTETTFSLRGGWVYAQRGWPLDEETYLAMRVELQ